MTFFAVGIYSATLGRVTTATVFAEDEDDARSRAEVEGLRGNGLEDDERIEYVSPLVAAHIPSDYPDMADTIADSFNTGYELGRADGCLEDGRDDMPNNTFALFHEAMAKPPVSRPREEL